MGDGGGFYIPLPLLHHLFCLNGLVNSEMKEGRKEKGREDERRNEGKEGRNVKEDRGLIKKELSKERKVRRKEKTLLRKC